MLPEGWSEFPLGQSVRIHAGVAPGQIQLADDGPVPYVKVEDLNNNAKVQLTSRTHLASEQFAVPRNSVIFPKRGAAIFLNKVRIAGVPLVLDTNLMAVECKADLDPHFLYYAITHAGLHRLADTSPIPQLNNKHILPYRLARPPRLEQNRIAAILGVWDQAIATTERLLANGREQTQTLMRLLLTGRRKVRSVEGHWRHVDLDQFFERVTHKNVGSNTNVLTISGQYGLISQREFFSKNIASENLASYTVLGRGEFAYNRSYSAGYPMGAIKPLERYDTGIVSSLYLCFRLRKPNQADYDFFRHYFEAGLLNEEIAGIAQEGARNHGLLNVSVVDFFKLRLHVPPPDERREIAEILNIAEAEERSSAEQLDRLQREKRALMSDLLTGKRRVRLPATVETAA